MATVIKNPVIIHCLQQFGITPAEARAIDLAQAIETTEADTEEEMSLAQQLAVAQHMLSQALHAAK